MVFRRVDKRQISSFDWLLLIAMLLLCGIGLVVIYSAGYDPQLETSKPMIKQAVSMGIGLVFFTVCIFINPTFWRRIAWPLYIAGCVLLLAVLLKGVVAGGARRWLEFGGFRMQPAEFMKIGLIMLFARLFSSESAPSEGYTIPTLIFPTVLLIIPTILIAKEPDLGTALCHLVIGGSMLLMAGIQRGTLMRIALAGALMSVPAWSMLKDYQRKRVLNFLSPEMDPLGSGYHAIQSKIAVGSGALTGKGFLKGTQTQLRFLPEQTTDFIFSVLAEEWGFLGSITVLALYTLLIFRILSICSKCQDSFSAYVSFGVASMMFWHVVINIGMVIGVVPVVGVTLKLLSYGGSSVIAAMAALGIVAGFSIRRFLFA
ncbi:MAG: rod shape-determining protein RodA [Bdellovibrionota bacterium]